MIATHGPGVISYRYHIHTLTRREAHMEIILGHTSDDMVVGKCPMGTHITVLYPDIRILGGKGIHRDGILDEHCRMGLARMMHDFPLITLQVLDGNHRGNQFAGSAEMIKLTTRQRQDGHLQLGQFCVVEGGMCAQSQAKFAIKVVLLQ